MQDITQKLQRARELKHRLEVLKHKKRLTHFDELTSPNYKLLHNAIKEQKWCFDHRGKPVLESGYAGAVLEGSSRSTKTWSGVDIIIWLCTEVEKSGCTINIYRETYNEFKTTLYDDFRRRLDDYDLDNPFKRSKEIQSFKILNSTIYFLGDGKHGGGCDYAFFNEVMMINRAVFDQVEMRCRKFWWMDYNPSFTDHWVFDSVIPREDVAFLRTTFRDNPYISPTELNKILGYEPWMPGSYEILPDGVFYNGYPISDDNQPPPHPDNIKRGTADEFMWKVYGLGLRGAMKGVIYQNIRWIDAFPVGLGYTYANDFGFTADPNVLVRYAEDGDDVFIEPLTYRPIETSSDLIEEFNRIGVEPFLPIACDSSDKYTKENHGTIEMVRDLRDGGFPEAYKISKKKGKIFWILSLKKKRIHIVRNMFYKQIKKEQENYKFKEVNGILVNQPIDGYDHFWDSALYGHMSHNADNYKIAGL